MNAKIFHDLCAQLEACTLHLFLQANPLEFYFGSLHLNDLFTNMHEEVDLGAVNGGVDYLIDCVSKVNTFDQSRQRSIPAELFSKLCSSR